MNQYGYALIGLTALVAMLVAVVTFAVLKFVADRASEADESGPDGPGRDVLAILGQAYGSGGSRRTVEVTVARVRTSAVDAPAPMELLSWRELR